MNMATRCPACDTLFRVTPQQLQAHQGQVRCGRCLTIFDGFRALAPLPEAGQAPQAAPDVVPAPAATGAVKTADAPAFELEPVETRGAAPEPAADIAVAPPAGMEDKDFGPAPQQLTLEDQLFLEQPRSPTARHTRLWAAASAVALLALAGQGAYVYRTELATHVPGLKRYVVQLCELLECSVPLPQRPRLIAIEASDLHVPDPMRPGVIQLTATLRNHAGYDLGYPALDLVLTNTREHTLARRIFLPVEYLARREDAAAGIPANAEVTVRFDLDTGDLNPAGFRLDLLPAPAP